MGCDRCGGTGVVVVCIDDMCRGAGECIHGDGEAMCDCEDADDEYLDDMIERCSCKYCHCSEDVPGDGYTCDDCLRGVHQG